MKITDPGIIKRGEQELLDSIKEKLDWKTIEELNKDTFKPGSFECTCGDIVVHDNQVAYKMDFEVRARFTLLFDREGNIIHTNGAALPDREAPEEKTPENEPVDIFTDADISDEAIADIEKELTEINTFHREADDILASLGADAAVGIPIKPGLKDGAVSNEPNLDDDTLFEELALPPDDMLGVLEEITAKDSKNDLKAALNKSKDFWSHSGEPSAKPQGNDILQKDELKLAFEKSQNFWLRKS